MEARVLVLFGVHVEGLGKHLVLVSFYYSSTVYFVESGGIGISSMSNIGQLDTDWSHLSIFW